MRFVTIAVCVAGAFGALAMARPHASRVERDVGVSPAFARRTVAKAPVEVRSTDDAKALLARASIRVSVGLTDAEIAATKPIYRFGGGTGTFVDGLSVFRAPLANGGYCIAFASAVGCTRVPPTDAEPLMGLGIDLDAERGGEPFVLVGVSEPQVRAVTYACAGKTYAATMSGSVVTFVAPSSNLRADDCTENVTLSGGKVVSKRV